MLIDLKTPKIKFKTGNFSVDENGYLIAQGGGSIAGWNIKDTSLSKSIFNKKGEVISSTGMSSDNSDKKNKAFWAGDSSDPSNAPFSVDFNGHVNATSMDIGGDDAN